MSKRVKFNEEEIEEQKQCHPGPNVKFTPRALPFGEYLANSDIEGSLGCGPGKYPRYKDGKYCCETEKASDQDNFDYVNYLLERVIENVPLEAFNKYTQEIEYLIYYHKMYLAALTISSTTPVENTLKLPDGDLNIDDWYRRTRDLAREYINAVRPDPPEGMPAETKRYLSPHIISSTRRSALSTRRETDAREAELKRKFKAEIEKHFVAGRKRKTRKNKSKKIKRRKSSKCK